MQSNNNLGMFIIHAPKSCWVFSRPSSSLPFQLYSLHFTFFNSHAHPRFSFSSMFFLFYSFSFCSCSFFYFFFSLFVVFVCSTDVSDSNAGCHTDLSISLLIYRCVCVFALLSMDATSNFPFRCIDKYFVCMHSRSLILFLFLAASNTLSFSQAITPSVCLCVFAFISQSPLLSSPRTVFFPVLSYA